MPSRYLNFQHNRQKRKNHSFKYKRNDKTLNN